MARYAIIESGVVANHAEADADYAALKGWVPAGDSRQGDLYDVAIGFRAPLLTNEQVNALRDTARAAVNAWRDVQEAATIVFAHAGRRWDGGLAVRTRLMPMLSLPVLPEGFFWTDADDNDVPVDAAALAALGAAHEAAIVTQGFVIHVRQRAMKAEIDALGDAAALLVYAPGWPDQADD